jgi:hypothetical protein
MGKTRNPAEIKYKTAVEKQFLILKYFYEHPNDRKITESKLRKNVGKGILKSALPPNFVKKMILYFRKWDLIEEADVVIIVDKKYQGYCITRRGKKLYELIMKEGNKDIINFFTLKPPTLK